MARKPSANAKDPLAPTRKKRAPPKSKGEANLTADENAATALALRMMQGADDPVAAAELGLGTWVGIATALLVGTMTPGSKGAADRTLLGRIYRAKWAAGEGVAAGKSAVAEAMLGRLTEALTTAAGKGRVIEGQSSPLGHASAARPAAMRRKLPF